MAADVIDVAFDRNAVELFDRQRDEKLDPVFEHDIGLAECAALLGFRAWLSGRIRHAPMGSDWIARPERADFAGGLVADCKDEIHDWRVGPREFIPGFAAQTAYRQMKPFEQVEGEGCTTPFGKLPAL